MDPPQLNKSTRAAVEVIPSFHDQDGTLCGVVLVKERFSVGPAGGVSRTEDAEIRIADELWEPDEPATSSIKYPSDLCQVKPSTDVIVVGSAIAPGGTPVTEMRVGLRVGPIEKELQVVGARAWYVSGGSRCGLTRPEPFEAMPLRWERAFGGADYETDPDNPLEEPRNPVGRGVVSDPVELIGTEGPNVELPDDPVTSQRSRPAPAGFGALCRNWSPRRGYSGTFDEQWMEERMPLLPLDFDPRFYQSAPVDQISPSPLRGGEPVQLLGMHADGPMVFRLPEIRFFVGVRTAEALTEYPPQLDTVLFEPNDRAFEMTWRSLVPLPRESSRLRYVQVNEKRLLR